MKHLSIKHVITSVVAILVGLTLAVGALGYYSTQRLVATLVDKACRCATRASNT